jgi:hypothetical protein
LFISHILNHDQVNEKSDFYFGKLPNDLVNNGRSVVIASLVHFKFNYSWFETNFIEGGLPRVFFSDTIKKNIEIEVHQRARKESKILKDLSKKESDSFVKNLLNFASVEAMSSGTHSALRLSYQIKDLLKEIRPKTIIVTYEGHAYERIIFATARDFNPNIKCISYQHSCVFRLSNAMRQIMKEQYNPDLILTSGIEGKMELQNSLKSENIAINVLGSIRGLSDSSLRIDFFKKCCLVIPEGFKSECYSLFKFSLKCAVLSPHIKFIWRLHPSISFQDLIDEYPEFNDLPSNICLSKNNLEEDILNSAWALYRGSTSIFKAISLGLRPLYLMMSDEISIDPLYKMENWKIIISDYNSFSSCIALDIDSDFQNHRENVLMAKIFCENYFSKIDVNVFNNL